jgi:hypothetical protein
LNSTISLESLFQVLGRDELHDLGGRDDHGFAVDGIDNPFLIFLFDDQGPEFGKHELAALAEIVQSDFNEQVDEVIGLVLFYGDPFGDILGQILFVHAALLLITFMPKELPYGK